MKIAKNTVYNVPIGFNVGDKVRLKTIDEIANSNDVMFLSKSCVSIMFDVKRITNSHMFINIDYEKYGKYCDGGLTVVGITDNNKHNVCVKGYDDLWKSYYFPQEVLEKI